MQNQDPLNQSEQYQSFCQGQIIFREGDPGDQMYIVAEGQIDIMTDDQLLETVNPGGILGEMALIDDKPRSATAVARTDCVLTLISRRHFLTLVERTPLFALQVMRIMAERLRRANIRLPS
jgi:CRP-like cAMP-binding protein